MLSQFMKRASRHYCSKAFLKKSALMCMGAQESILKAAVTEIVPKQNRSSGFGIFQTAFGICWFLGSWLLGILYDFSPPGLVIFSAVMQLIAVPIFWLSYKGGGFRKA